jgi:hypothetical protein
MIRFVFSKFLDLDLASFFILGLDSFDAFLQLLNDSLSLSLLIFLHLLRVFDLVIIPFLEVVVEILVHCLLLVGFLLLCLS